MIELQINERPTVTNPFPGLRSFEIDEAEYFFGREDDIYDLLERLRCTKFLSVVGASGCGKSSLIKAGLIATLQDGFMVENGVPWRFAVMRPWQNPIRELAFALGSSDVLDVTSRLSDNTVEELEFVLRKGSLGIIEALKKWQLPQNNKLLILVDQFEELFAFMDKSEIKSAKDEARAFIKLLLEASQEKSFPVYIALTMRSEFLSRCVELPGLPEAINSGLYLLPQMERDQLRDVIKAPVDLVYRNELRKENDNGNAKQLITEGLVDTILNELREEDQLPILQHALMRLWDEWQKSSDEKIGIAHYERIGRLENALSKHVDEVYKKLTSEEQKIAEVIFRSITDTLEGGNIVRKKLKLWEIYKLAPDISKNKINEVIGKFAADNCSFLILSDKRAFSSSSMIAPYPEDTDVDISHESLIRQWEQLRKWANEEAKLQEIYKDIKAGTLKWRKRGRSEDVFFRGVELTEAYKWYESNSDKLNDSEKEFIDKSFTNYQNELLNKPKKELADKIIEEGSNRSEAIEKGDAYVFFSYNRKDQSFAQRLQRKLEATGKVRVVDWKILPSEEYSSQVSKSIQETDAFVFFISENSIGSKVCLNELDEAIRLNKRIIPVSLQKVDYEIVPHELKNYQWINFDKRGIDGVVSSLAKAIGSDLYWARAHSRLLIQATEWNTNDREKSLLLSGKSLEEAEQLLSMEKPEPPLTPLQLQYIQASREHLNKEQNKRSRIMTAGLAIIAIFFLSAAVLAFAADRQRRFADQQRLVAEQETQRAVDAENNAKTERDKAIAAENTADIEKNRAIEAKKETEKERDKTEEQRQIAQRATAKEKEERKKAEQAAEMEREAKQLAESRREEAEKQTILAKEAEKEAKKQTEFATAAREQVIKLNSQLYRALDEARKAKEDSEKQRAIAEEERDKAQKLERQANEEKQKAEKLSQIATAGKLGFQAERLVDEGNFETAVLVATESFKLSESMKELPEVNADNALRRAVTEFPLLGSNLTPSAILILPHAASVETAKFANPLSQFIVTSSDRIVRVINVSDRKETFSFLHTSKVSTAFFVPYPSEGFTLITVTEDNKVYLIGRPDNIPKDLPITLDTRNSSKEYWRSLDFKNQITSIVYNENKKALAIATGDEVQIFSLENNKKLTQISHKGKKVLSAVFSPDGNFLATADGDEAHVWEVSTGREVSHTEGNDGDVFSVIFSPDGQYIATASKDLAVRIWTTTAGLPLASPITLDNSITGLQFNSNGKILAVSSGSNVYLFALDENKSATTREAKMEASKGMQLEHDDLVREFNFSPNGLYLVTASTDGKARIWDVATGKIQTEMKHEKGVNSASFSSDGRFVVTGSIDQTARVWNISAVRDILKPLKHESIVRAVALSPGGEFLATGSNGKVIVWNVDDYRQENTLVILAADTRQEININSVAFSKLGSWLAVAADDSKIRVWNWLLGNKFELNNSLNQTKINSVSFNSNNEKLVAATSGKQADIYDTNTRKVIASLQGHTSEVNTALFNPINDKMIATAGNDATVRIWDISDISIPKSIKVFNLSLDVTDIAFSPDGKLIAATNGNSVQIWDVNNGTKVDLTNEIKHSANINAIVWSADGKYLATASNDSNASIWSISDKNKNDSKKLFIREVARMNHNPSNAKTTSIESRTLVNAIAFSSEGNKNGRYLATGSSDNSARLWLWKPEDLINDACLRIKRSLSDDEWRQYAGDEQLRLGNNTCSDK